MHARFLLGPAGSGKTFRCLTEIRRALAASPDGPPLLLIAPKQSTYQLERQFLAYPSTPGYTRLHILSFERLAYFIFDRLEKGSPAMLDEEGRLMVLRGLLAKKRDDLKLFRASARLTGFAQQLSLVLRELQRQQLTPEALNQLAEQVRDIEGLAFKLQDLATLLRDYLDWLKTHQLQDADCLLAAAAKALKESSNSEVRSPSLNVDAHASRITHHSPRITPTLGIEQLWVDGFAEWSPQELDLLAALLPSCQQATLTFCLDQAPTQKTSWLSSWSVVRQSFLECKKKFGALIQDAIAVEVLPRQPTTSRFLNNPVLSHLERSWADPRPYAATPDDDRVAAALRVAVCPNLEAEATLAAREIRQYIRAGGRYRDVTVLARKLDAYHEPIQRVFSRYEVPYFLDRREVVSHHPLAELTRSALRTVAFQWRRDDWFAALKTGLAQAEEIEIDRLETEALARGWQGAAWQEPVVLPKEPELTAWLADLHHRLLPPFQRLSLAMAARQNKPTGLHLAAALREFWRSLGVEERLAEWASAEISNTDFRIPSSVHATVWEQMNVWLRNVELAFPAEPLPLREWLPILEAGLANLTVGVIPPALDQVLIGAIDRSRNPDIKLALVLGLNEGLFPAPPETTVLLSDADRLELEKRSIVLGATARQQLGRERYHAYIACTRARQRLVLTAALHDAAGSPLNPSPFLSHVRQLFPTLPLEVVPPNLDWRESEHASELIAPLLKAQNQDSQSEVRSQKSKVQNALAAIGGQWPALFSILEQLRHFQNPQLEEALAPKLAARLYGPVLCTSVSRMEHFAACPFKFFVHSGLRAQERQLFELDVREQGSFQHDVLALFHEQLHSENKRWRDITPTEARERIARIAQGLMASYRDGLLEASEQSRFMARILTESLQDFAETLVEWMRTQYQFDPVEVELPFGEDETSPVWAIPLDSGRRLELYGRIDRVDMGRDPQTGEMLCVVLDYKSSQKQLDPVLLAYGLQLQLLTYLNVLRHFPDPREAFGADRLVPAGVFYVNLRGKYGRELNRIDALAEAAQARKLAYRHTGRFDTRALRLLDSRPDTTQGDQFNFRLTKDGQVYKSSREAMATAEFIALLDSVEENLKKMGQSIYAGQAKVAPYRKGPDTACDQCGYQSICRIDPWTHSFRVLKKPDAEEDGKTTEG